MIVFQTPGYADYHRTALPECTDASPNGFLISLPRSRIRFKAGEWSILRQNIARLEFQVRGDRHLTCHFHEHDRRFGYFHVSDDDESWYVWVRASREMRQGLRWAVTEEEEILITGTRQDLRLFWDQMQMRSTKKATVDVPPTPNRHRKHRSRRMERRPPTGGWILD